MKSPALFLLPLTMSEYLLYTAPILAGTQANWALMATLAIQVYTFHTRFPNERRWIKLLVYTVFPLELAQTGVSSHYAYWLLALGWGDTTMLGILPWSCFATPIFVSITAALVQIFFAWSGYYLPVEAKKLDPLKAYSCRRIYLLMLKTVWALVLTAVIVLLALMQGVVVLLVVVQFAHTTAFANVMRFVVSAKVNHPSFFDLPTGAWLMIAAVCDVLITTTLIIIFFKYRLQMPSEERRADTFMVKLMLNTVETGAVTSVAALICLVLFLLYPGYNLAETPTFILGKLYANVLLFTLNARAGSARRRYWTTEAQNGVGMFTSIHTTYATHAASDCFDSP
ncbi:hypothetical protein B0H19DRAFT_1271805 [Mycena capillaripes]|nr:hypothetical protein B0H19DRAFT_1271805 [Mycena capillaripes]